LVEGGGARHHRVPPEARGERLDAHLARAFPDLSRARLRQLIDQGMLTVSGRAPKPALRLKGGEEVALVVPPPAPAEPAPQDLPLRVLHEDADLLVLDKAAGMVVHPAAGHAEGTLVNALLHRVKDLRGVGGQLRPGIVHRLDRDTSGCLVVAKHDQALAELQRAFRGREVSKRYLAIVHGAPRAARATLDTPYGRHPTQRKKFTGRLREGKRAVTSYEVKERFGAAALLEVELHTGRTHQIRVHLAEAGHPLLGDALYGRTRPAPIGRQALHAWKLGFPHPRTGRRMDFEAPVPPDFAAALAALREG